MEALRAHPDVDVGADDGDDDDAGDTADEVWKPQEHLAVASDDAIMTQMRLVHEVVFA